MILSISVRFNFLLLLLQESRQNRVDSWKAFQAGSGSSKVKSKKMKGFKPPKHKAESR